MRFLKRNRKLPNGERIWSGPILWGFSWPTDRRLNLNRGWWFRLGAKGPGLSYEFRGDLGHWPLFSERYGHDKTVALRIGPHLFTILRPTERRPIGGQSIDHSAVDEAAAVLRAPNVVIGEQQGTLSCRECGQTFTGTLDEINPGLTAHYQEFGKGHNVAAISPETIDELLQKVIDQKRT